MKVVLSNKIYLPYSEELYLKLHEELTYAFQGRTPNSPQEIISTLTAVGQKALLIPIGRMDLIKGLKDVEIIDKRVTPKAIIPKPKFTLRESQQEFVDLIDEDNDTYILNGRVGYGKSFAALALAYKLQVKTLIVVNTLKLRTQWMSDIREQFGFEPGIIGSGKFDIQPAIVVGNVQTLSKHADKYHTTFGLVIGDEIHHTPSSTFTKIIASTKAKYRIGLTATLARRDQKQILTYDYFGKNNVYVPPLENTMEPKIILCNSGFKIPGGKVTPWALRINKLTENPAYQSYVINLVNALVARGRKILIVSDRVSFLETCADLTNKAICITGVTEDQEELQDSIKNGENQALYGSINIFKEGISLNYLDTLVLSNPIASEPLLEQIVGRIMRMYKDKKTPEVYDICFDGYTGENQLRTRMAFYTREKYAIKEINI